MTSFRDLLLYMTAFFSLPVLSVSDDFSVIKQSLSEDVMMVSTKRGFSPQLVIAAEKGLTVFNTLWGEEIASQYRSIVQQTFNRKDFIYVGKTEDLKRRLKEHNNKEELSTKHYAPFELTHYEAYRSKVDAERREKYLKTHYGRMFLKNRLKSYFTG